MLQASGRVPGTAAGDLQVQLLGLDLHDVYGLLQRDTAGVHGEVELDLQMGGTAAAPTFRGLARLADGRFGDFQSPFVQGVLNYEARRLDANLDLWRTGENLLQVEAHLPLDLALTGVEKRQIDGPLSVRAQTRQRVPRPARGASRRPSPASAGPSRRTSRWAAPGPQPRLAGAIDIRNGSMSLPGLGVRFGGVRGGATLEGDSVRLRDVVLTSGGGELAIGGLDAAGEPLASDPRPHAPGQPVPGDRRAQLPHPRRHRRSRAPRPGLRLDADRRADRQQRRAVLRGPGQQADHRPRGSVDRRPGGHDPHPPREPRRQVPEPVPRLAPDRATCGWTMGSDVWLRSAEANIQLEGRMRLSKRAQTYNPTGTLNAPRGTYTLKIGPVTRDFTVTRGQVTYTGDLNAGLDIAAQHTVRSVRGDEIPVVASITGTLYAAEAHAREHRPAADLGDRPDLVPHHRLSGQRGHAARAGRRAPDRPVLLLQRALERARARADPGHRRADRPDRDPPGRARPARPAAASLTQLAAGWQIGKKTFLTFNAGFCPDFSQLSYKNLGASLEFRFSREWKLQSAVEPTIQSCSSFGTTNRFANTSLYQIGFDILWEREF